MYGTHVQKQRVAYNPDSDPMFRKTLESFLYDVVLQDVRMDVEIEPYNKRDWARVGLVCSPDRREACLEAALRLASRSGRRGSMSLKGRYTLEKESDARARKRVFPTPDPFHVGDDTF